MFAFPLLLNSMFGFKHIGTMHFRHFFLRERKIVYGLDNWGKFTKEETFEHDAEWLTVSIIVGT